MVNELNLEINPATIEKDGKNYVLIEEDKYQDLIKIFKEVLIQNREFKLEQKILNEMPIDFYDVKVVVKKELENDSKLSIEKAVENVKYKHPNLFHKIDIGSLESLFI